MYLNQLSAAGVMLSLSDYRDLAAINRDDIVLWKRAEQQRIDDAVELAKLEAGHA